MRESFRISAAVHCLDAKRPLLLAGLLLHLGKRTMPDSAPRQLLHLVIGGELIDLEHNTFKDLDKVEIVGVYPNYATAYAAWKAKAQATVDNAQMRYFVVHLHRLLDPERDHQDEKSAH
jgi:Domain of unknown function (DUF4170)